MHRLTESAAWDVFKGWCALTLGVVLVGFGSICLIVGLAVLFDAIAERLR